MLTKFKTKLQKFKNALAKTRNSFLSKIHVLFGKPLNEETLLQLEQILYEADLGSQLVESFISRLEKKLKGQKEISSETAILEMRNLASELLNEPPKVSVNETIISKPHVILMVGINGTGKTTSCAKLAYLLKNQGKKVLLVAADTFRAAAIEQLTLWAQRLQIDIVKGKPGGDPSAVVFDALTAAKARGSDFVIVDTAGRLESKTHLMEELAKIRRVASKIVPGAPHETFLVVDATTGQNAVEVTKIFHSFTPLNGIVLTKIDGSAKGGIVLSIYKQVGIPVRFIGLGESEEDFSEFDKNSYLEAHFPLESV